MCVTAHEMVNGFHAVLCYTNEILRSLKHRGTGSLTRWYHLYLHLARRTCSVHLFQIGATDFVQTTLWLYLNSGPTSFAVHVFHFLKGPLMDPDFEGRTHISLPSISQYCRISCLRRHVTADWPTLQIL